MAKFNPFAREIKYLQTVNKAIALGYPLYVYRTVDAKVQKIEIALMGIDLYSGKLNIQYGTDKITWKQENASELDLQMISQQAQQYQKQAMCK